MSPRSTGWRSLAARCAPRLGLVLALVLALVLGLAAPLSAQTLRVASAFDPQTLDPHALALLYHTRVTLQVYEPLVNYDEQYRPEPGLALSWQMATPTTWRLSLRPGVVFHDGTPFSADDAVFSLQRAMGKNSQRAFMLQGVTAVRKIDAQTIELQTAAPDAVLPDKLTAIAMMSRAWSERHGVVETQNFNAKQETHAIRHANGTGPYKLQRYAPDVETVLVRHDAWWGRDDPRHGRLDAVRFITIKSDATRLAALASGEVDLVLDPPFQDIARLQRDPRIKLAQTADIGQQYLAFDQARAELQDSDVKGRNPFQDKRVRQAVYQAINIDLIVRQVLRGQAVPTGAFLSTRVDGSPAALDRRLPYDPARAKALLAEAGYPDGFAVTLDCVNVAWREKVCQAAAAMLTQVGIRTTLRSTVANQFFPKLTQGTGSFMEFGWTPITDAWTSLNALFRSYTPDGRGTFNAGRYRNPELDAMIDAIRVEPDRERRRERVAEVLQRVADELPLVPLYRRTLTWAMSDKVTLAPWPNDQLELRFVKMK